MADLQTLVADIVATLEGPGFLLVRVPTSDYREDMARLAEGASYYQIRAQYENQEHPDSGQPHWLVSIELVFLYRVPVDDERNYTTDVLVANAQFTNQALLLDHAWWRARSGVYAVSGGPEMEDEVTRIGNVMRWSMKTAVLLTP